LIVTRDDEFRDSELLEEDIPFIQDELDNVTNIMYMIIEGVRNDREYFKAVEGKLCMGVPRHEILLC
jgi:hypothetical protein